MMPCFSLLSDARRDPLSVQLVGVNDERLDFSAVLVIYLLLIVLVNIPACAAQRRLQAEQIIRQMYLSKFECSWFDDRHLAKTWLEENIV